MREKITDMQGIKQGALWT